MSATPGLYEQVLAAAGGELPAARAPRASAAVVPWRRAGGSEIELFWLRRGEILPFMGGWHAFPGGGLERGDALLPMTGEPSGQAVGGWTSASPDPTEAPRELDLVPGLAACALRELFEETGMLVARAADGGGPEGLPSEGGSPLRIAEMRQRQLAGEKCLGPWLEQSGLTLDADRLRFAGRWLTPPFSPARFDNRFFLLEWRAEDGEPRVVPPESEEGEWIRPAAALARLAAGEAIAAPPILHLLRVLGEAGVEGGAARLLDPSEAHLGPLPRIEVRPGIVLFPLAAATLPPAAHTNAYLLGTRECVLVDPGSPFESENARLLAALASAEKRHGRKVTAIWLTHHHPDHVGGVETLRRALDVPVFGHARTAERLQTAGIALDGHLADGQRIALDGTPEFLVRVHHTPGHASGHLCFEVEATGDLVAGDMVAGFGTIVIDPPEGDMDQYLSSLDRLRTLAPRTLFVGHGAPFLDSVAKLTEYRDHRLAREAQVLASWEEGLRAPAEIVPRVYSDLAPGAVPLAERQVLAHLTRLERLGRIRR